MKIEIDLYNTICIFVVNRWIKLLRLSRQEELEFFFKFDDPLIMCDSEVLLNCTKTRSVLVPISSKSQYLLQLNRFNFKWGRISTNRTSVRDTVRNMKPSWNHRGKILILCRLRRTKVTSYGKNDDKNHCQNYDRPQTNFLQLKIIFK